MDKNSVSPAAGDAREPAFYTMKVAREFGEELARQYKAVNRAGFVGGPNS